MGLIERNKNERFLTSGVWRLSTIGFFVALAYAAILTVWSLYLDSYFNNTAFVGFFSAMLTFTTFASYFATIPLIEKGNKAKLMFFALAGIVGCSILFATDLPLWGFTITALVFTFFVALNATSYGIIFKNASKKKKLSRNQGVRFTLLNIAHVVGPLIAGYIAFKFGVRPVFLLAAGIIILATILHRTFQIKSNFRQEKAHKNMKKNFISFFKDKDRRLTYILRGGVGMWLILVFLFMPLHITRAGLSTLWIGYFLFAASIPLMLFEFVFARRAGKYGFKKTFQLGFLIAAIFTLACLFSPNIYVTMALIVCSSVGIAMLEPTIEAYFFDILKKKEGLRYYGPYNTANTILGFFAKIISSSLLLVLPFKILFAFYGLALLSFFFTAGRVSEVIEIKLGDK